MTALHSNPVGSLKCECQPSGFVFVHPVEYGGNLWAIWQLLEWNTKVTPTAETGDTYEYSKVD